MSPHVSRDVGPDVRLWRLDTATRTVVFASFDGGVPALVHFGARLPDDEALDTLARMTLPDVAGGQLDPLVPLTLLPTAMSGWQGHPGLIMGGAEVLPDLALGKVTAQAGQISFDMDDRNGGDSRSASPITITARLDTETGALALSVMPQADIAGRIAWLALAVPIPADMARIIDHGGRWCGEFQRQETRFRTGQHVRESREGRTGHAHFPGVTVMAEGADKTHGRCMAVALGWSGGHKMIAEEIPDGRRQLQFGLAADQPSGAWQSPLTIWLAWSDVGENGLSHAMTGTVRAVLPRPSRRPVHYNCWEAVYFDHSPADLMDIAARAAALGAERFVLDDGWFKGRNDDTSSLGDWDVDRAKYPDGLQPLIDHVQGLGMEFGIWFEPEMVNRNSDLYRAHPEWVQGPDGQPAGRNQFVLDLTKPGVCDYLFDKIAAFLRTHSATYIKWDHNRILTGGTPEQTRCLYALMARLNAAFPHVEIESCSSGGGRIDYGILHHTTRVWLSDSNDALERLRMQHEAAHWLPAEVQGSHVGPRHCHTSGRVFSMAFRAWVAAQRHMGFEMDPRELTQEEADTLKEVTAWYRANRDHLFAARQYRIDSHDPQVFAELFVDHARDRFILFKGQAGPSAAIASRPFALPGLDERAQYALHLVNPDAVPPVLNRTSATGFGAGEPVFLSGQALAQGALRLPNAFPASMFVIEGRRYDPQKGKPS